MDGSKLARGERSASFQVEGTDEFIHDLKTLTRDLFQEKYECDREMYAELIAYLAAGKEIKPLPPNVALDPETKGKLLEMTERASKEDAPFRATVKVPEKVSYKADCRGDNVLVIRVEREHSSQFIIPESAKAKSDVGRVAAKGPDVKRCEVGELVLFDRFAAHGKEIELVDEQGIPRQHLLLNDVDVLLGLRRFVPAASEPSPSES